MAQSFQSIENVLKRAQEHVDVGQKAIALDLLFDLLTSRRHRTWQKAHEQAIRLFIELNVELRNHKMAKEGLHEYRAITHSVPQALDSAIAYLLDLSDAKTNAAVAAAKSNLATTKLSASIQDLEAELSPEAMLLATLGTERERTRGETATLVPWLVFSWENLRTVLELLRNNPHLETTYHSTATRAFNFCLAHERKVEFRRLCEMLRNHLSHQQKYAKDDEGRLQNETMERHLLTRFEQLKAATSLSLWFEGYRTIEDIHKIMILSLKKPNATLMATYYQKLTQLFLVSGSFLFHAYAYKAYYDTSRERGQRATQEQVRIMASSVLLAAMAIPPPSIVSSSPEDSGKRSTALAMESSAVQKEKNRRMAELLGFDVNPDREALLTILKSNRVIDDADVFVKELYELLERERDFDPSTLCARCAVHVAKVRADSRLEPYANAIESLIVIRLVAQLARVFLTVRLEDFHSMVDSLGTSSSIKRLDAERLVVKASRARQIAAVRVSIDHASRAIRFGQNSLEQARTRDVLSTLAKRLNEVCKVVRPAAPAPPAIKASAEDVSVLESELMTQRRELIAKRKHEMEGLLTYRVRAKARQEQMDLEARTARDLERANRVAEEKARAEAERLAKAEEEARQAAKLKSMGVDVASLLLEGVSLTDKEKELKEKRMKLIQVETEQEKRVSAKLRRTDVLIRAAREAERPALSQERARRVQQDLEDFTRAQENTFSVAKEAHAESLRKQAEWAIILSNKSGFDSFMAATWNSSIEKARQNRTRERNEIRRMGKMKRAHERMETAHKQKLAEDQSRRMAESERLRIQKAEEEIERKRAREGLTSTRATPTPLPMAQASASRPAPAAAVANNTGDQSDGNKVQWRKNPRPA